MGDKISFTEMRKSTLDKVRSKNLHASDSNTPSRVKQVISFSTGKPNTPSPSSPSRKQRTAESEPSPLFPPAAEKDQPTKPNTEKRAHKRKWFDVTQNVEPHSFWHHDFNPHTLIDTQMLFLADVDLVNKYGAAAPFEAAQIYALRTTELIRIAEKERIQAHQQMEKMSAEFTEVEKLKKELLECKQERNLLNQQQQDLKQANDALSKELKQTKDAQLSAISDLKIARISITTLEKNLASQKVALDIRSLLLKSMISMPHWTNCT